MLYNWLYARRDGRAGRAARSRTPTARDRPRRRSSRPRASCAGSVSTGTRGRTRRRSATSLLRAAAADLSRRADAAYRCYCTDEELEVEREPRRPRARRSSTRGRCRWSVRRGAREPEAAGRRRRSGWRCPTTGTTAIDDVVRGPSSRTNALQGDHVIVRSDGTPTYLFANPFDDIRMGITHVIRGEDLLPSTPRQLARLRRARGRAADATRTCPWCSAPTRRSSRSATAPSRSRSSATAASCRRRSSTTSRSSAGATTTTRP